MRYIVPKDKPFDCYGQEDVTKIMNHINSYPKMKWNGNALIDLFMDLYGKETTTLLGLEKIDPDSIATTYN